MKLILISIIAILIYAGEFPRYSGLLPNIWNYIEEKTEPSKIKKEEKPRFKRGPW